KNEFINPSEIKDPRVRQALSFALDRQGLLDGLQSGEGQYAEGFLVPGTNYYDRALKEITRYPHDLAQADRLMQAAGLVKQSDRLRQAVLWKRRHRGHPLAGQQSGWI